MEEIKEAVRWNIKVSKETDLTLRTYLGAQGMKKGDLSKFIEEAVRFRRSRRAMPALTPADSRLSLTPLSARSALDAARKGKADKSGVPTGPQRTTAVRPVGGFG